MKNRLVLTLVSLFLAALSSACAATEDSFSGCTTTADGSVVDGSSIWTAVPKGEFAIDCEFHQLGWNNFLYLAGDDGSGHPRFMSFGPWYDVLPAQGAPVWPGAYNPLDGIQLRKAENETQTGDSFWLVDVAQGVTAYDIRVNDRFFNYIAQSGVYTETALQAQVSAYDANPGSGGIWLPPTSNDDTEVGIIEIKTSWRDYGPQAGACPSDVMHCETDSKGSRWGLVGILLVQKVTGHGEMLWTVFEHVANVPDCASGHSTPIAQNPTDPVTGDPFNVNSGSTATRTGWSYFDYTSYRGQGGDGSTCAYPDGAYAYNKSTGADACGAPSTTPLCNTDPRTSSGGFQQVDICRTDPLPTAATSCVGPDNSTPEQSSRNVSCLNRSVLDNFPSGLAAKWKYYKMIGTEWMYDGASNFGANLTGCFQYDSINSNPVFASTCKGGAAENNVTRRGNPNLASATSETWLQKGMCLPSQDGSSVSAVALDCFSCHQPHTTKVEGDLSHFFGRITQSGSQQKLLMSLAAGSEKKKQEKVH